MSPKEIEGFPGYRVYDDGRVESCRKTRGVWTPMRPGKDSHGYFQVSLRREGKSHNFMVHRLVAEAFIGPRPEKHEVCHFDGVKTNNRVENLRYGTHEENMLDRHWHGTANQGNGKPLKLNAAKVVEIRAECAKSHDAQHEVAKRFGVSRSMVRLIVKRKRWKTAEELVA